MLKSRPSPPPPSGNGLWVKIEASLRPLEPWEKPSWCPVPDDRMVCFGERGRGGMLAPPWVDTYSPLDTPSLPADFMRLFGGERMPRDDRVVEFYRRYGHVGNQKTLQESPVWLDRLSARARSQLSEEARLGLCEPLWWVAEEARQMRLCYELYRAFIREDLSSVRALLGEVPQGEEVRGIRLSPTGISLLTAEAEPEVKSRGRRRAGPAAVERPAESVSAQVPRRPLNDQECYRWGWRLLADQLTVAQERSSVNWLVEEEEGRCRLVKGRRFRDLVVAMYLQLGEMMDRRELYRTCRGCGGPFWPARGKQRFCDPRCGDAYRQRRFYRQSRTAGS